MVFALVALVAVAVTVQLKPLNPGGSVASEVSTIQSYDVKMVLYKDGTLITDETITVEFPIPRHGIFRIFDTTDPRRADVPHPIDSLRVWRDGVSEPWQWISSAPGTETARIGSADQYIGPGTFTYRLLSQTHDVLEPKVENGKTDPATTRWWWDVIGSGWQMPISNVNVQVTLPAAPTEVDCVMGQSTPCTPTVDGTSLRLNVPSLAPREPVTLRVGMPSSEVPPNGSPAVRKWALALGAGAVGAMLAGLGLLVTRERKPGFPVLYEPPPGVRPAVGVEVLDEAAATDALQATLFDLGERGVVRIESSGENWVVELVADPIAAHCDPWEVEVLSNLGLSQLGGRFTVSNTVTAGHKISTANSTLASGVHTATRPYLDPSAIGVLVRLFAWIGWIALIAIAGFHFFGNKTAPLPLVIFIAGFTVVASFAATDPGTSTKRSEAGRDVWSRTGGFARFLTTDSSESRFDAAAHLDWYPRYLPWAVALGVGDEWTKRYQAQGVEVPDVPYVAGWYAMGGLHGFSDFNNSFNSAISSASAAYVASQAASSSGGGGGFSGGSGGGGGGGGSW